ncbi:hypothetical protein [Francisella philomiragia]|uniref:Lipase n=1 Tax=Francisella philomiragia TaxID=28110 RepID=A0AAW3DC66_9GAMM|nr:hypothetical protein [Francisella philomiragia]KFJ43371.1 hypothetical protein DR78_1875 [Francisella philomiragia]MBK2255497.1 hypothetical protein [Francisella philomiragia]MBK2273847.1 hypothetical protein [Francisella philomiragia]MBK2277187.1 hypothetical protein [Francisella philomiragia]MBK2283548.1 hypothetical protein [Francisella philomiragia]
MLGLDNLGFTGHSLGGSITQIQTLYFNSYDVNLSPDKTHKNYCIKVFLMDYFWGY